MIYIIVIRNYYGHFNLHQNFICVCALCVVDGIAALAVVGMLVLVLGICAIFLVTRRK